MNKATRASRGWAMVVVVMRVCGSGKTRIGELLAERLACSFGDGDAFHRIGSRVNHRGGVPACRDDGPGVTPRLARTQHDCHSDDGLGILVRDRTHCRPGSAAGRLRQGQSAGDARSASSTARPLKPARPLRYLHCVGQLSTFRTRWHRVPRKGRDARSSGMRVGSDCTVSVRWRYGVAPRTNC